jgi:hypothetical protein
MARACDRWIIRDLVFAPSPESTSWSAGIYGIRLEAATAPIVSNVRFEGVGFGVLLSEVRQGVVEGSTFSNCTRRDIMIEDRGLVAACSGRGSSFSLPLGYSVPVSEAGSANCTVRDTRHFRELPGTTAISIRANGLTTIQNAEFVGAPSSTFISRELPARPATSLMTIRDCAFELSSAPPAALISNRVAGMVVIENLELGDSPPGPLYSVAQASGATMTVFENIPALPTGWTIAMADACDDAFQFFNVVSEVPVTDPSLWSGGLVAPILTVDSAGLKKLPSAVSGCPTPALQPGMMRFDATGHLKGRTSARDVQFHSGVQ